MSTEFTPNPVMLDRARDAIRQRGRASAVVLQKALGIGYRHAVALLDELTARGELGPDITTNNPASGSREIRFK